MSRLVDVDKLMAALTSAGVHTDPRTSAIIISAPTVDAEVVTRCIDCVHCVNPFAKGAVYCAYWHNQVTTKHSYCSAARKAGKEINNADT